MHQKTCVRTFIEALLVMARMWKLSKYLLAVEWVNNKFMGSSHRRILYNSEKAVTM